jgi:uncharacterized protein (DUF934 family)
MPIINKNGILHNPKASEIILENTSDIANIWPEIAQLQIIGIEFPNHADGRGFSIAKQIRRKSYEGILRAIGPLIPDQFPDAIACGIDEIEISENQILRQPWEQWERALKTYRLSYQRANGAKQSILELRGQKA